MKKRGVRWGSIILALLVFSPLISTGGRGDQALKPDKLFNINKLQKYPQINGHPVPYRDFGQVPLYFIPNKGQVDERALFYATTSRYTLWMTKEGLAFDSTIREGSRDVSRLVFVGANKNPEIMPLEPAENRANYFIGRDPAKWETDIPTSQAVLYKELYPGIDLKVYGLESQIEYDWVVKPGARVEDIRLEYKDVEDAAIDAEGNLIIATRFGQLTHHRPESYQLIEGRRVEVESKFIRRGERTFGFAVDPYEPAHDLVIDPILVYSTYLGGSGDDFARDIAVDGTGAAYVVGWTNSSNFPLKNSYQRSINVGTDIFIAKFSPSGNALVYSTFLGGDGDDQGYAIAVGGDGSAYVTGTTRSSNFPLMNPFQNWGCGVFATKLAPAGNALSYSTMIGGDGIGKGIVVDAAGAAYLTGRTQDAHFPLQNPFQSVKKQFGNIAFVTKIAPAGNTLVFSTFLGGSIWDEGKAIAVDSQGSAYVTGFTDSSDFPLLNPLQKKIGGSVDAFVSKFSPGGDALIYSTYLGGRWWDWPYGIDVDYSGAAYIVGETYSWNFPVKNAFQKAHAGLLDAFISKLSPSGQSLSFSTYLGGANFDEGYAITVDRSGAAYITGETWSEDFPLQAPFQKTAVEGGVFIAKFVPLGNSLTYSTLLGGNHRDWGVAIALDAKGAIYLAGDTYSTDFPQSLAYQKTNKGSCDAFLAKLNLSIPVLCVRAPDGGETLKRGSTQTLRWDYLGTVGATVKIELIQGSKLSATIAPHAPIGKNGNGSYKWTVPLSQPTGGDFKIRITSIKDKSYTDTSDSYFGIFD